VKDRHEECRAAFVDAGGPELLGIRLPALA
jgi:hypothetical protein